jgi:hypothetical protein
MVHVHNPSGLRVKMSFSILIFFKYGDILDFSCISPILSIHMDSFSMFSVFEQMHSAYSQTDLFCVFSNTHSDIPLEDLPHSTCFPFTYRFIPHIVSITTDSSCVSSIYTQIHSAYLLIAPLAWDFWVRTLTHTAAINYHSMMER